MSERSLRHQIDRDHERATQLARDGKQARAAGHQRRAEKLTERYERRYGPLPARR